MFKRIYVYVKDIRLFLPLIFSLATNIDLKYKVIPFLKKELMNLG